MRSVDFLALVAMLSAVAIVGIVYDGTSERAPQNTPAIEQLPPFAIGMDYTGKELGKFPRGPLPRTLPGTWISYSTAAVVSQLEGAFRYRLVVDPYGEVAKCDIVLLSGEPAVDQRACGAIMTNARFYPAVDKNQEPVRGVYEGEADFRLTGRNTYIGVLASVGPDGTLRGCRWATPELSSGDPLPKCRERLKVWRQYARENDIQMPAARDIPISFPPQLLRAGRRMIGAR